MLNEREREEEKAPSVHLYCFLHFWVPDQRGNTHLSAWLRPSCSWCTPPLSPSFCPTCLLLCHRDFFVLSLRSLRHMLLMFSPLAICFLFSSCVSVCQLIAWPCFSPVRYLVVHTLSYFRPLYISLMRTLHRLKLMSSPSLSELGKSEKSSPEDRGEKQKRAGANATWNRYIK